ncbi:MAG: hypothetical protein IAI50_04985, partial [Candidatus Eremiobacteraeota bacterium]|nr:hypothetical protein [Candidatus Eremiobacteraeota bacterium]
MNVFRIVRCFGLASIALAVVALGSVARAESPSGAPIDGISCDRAEGAVFH